MNNFIFNFYFIFLAVVVTILFLSFIIFLRRKIENCSRASEIRQQGVVWTIPLPETTELPSYQELQPNPEKPPGYWTLYNKPVIKETLWNLQYIIYVLNVFLKYINLLKPFFQSRETQLSLGVLRLECSGKFPQYSQPTHPMHWKTCHTSSEYWKP